MALAMVLVAGTAHAGQVCKDEWGRTYVVAQALVARLATFTCEAQASAPITTAAPAVVEAAAPSPVALAPSPRPAPPSGSGRARLRLIAVGMRAGDARAAPDDSRFDRFIAAAARRFDHDVGLLRAIVQVESGFDPDAVSPKGAIGLMQVMPSTARAIGIEAPERALFDPQTNLLAGARVLRQLMDRFPDRPDLAIAAYNAGEAAVLRHGGRVPPYPETQSYVRRVQARALQSSRW